MICFIYAEDKNNVVGVGNRLPIHDKEELSYFRKTTKGHCVVMGYNTWISIGSKPLPHRRNFVIAKSSDNTTLDDQLYFSTVEDILKMEEKYPYLKYFILGGPKTFKLFEDYVSKLYISHGNYRADDSPDNIKYILPDNIKNRMVLESITNLTNFKCCVYTLK